MVCRRHILLVGWILFFIPASLWGAQYPAVETKAIAVLYDEPLRPAAREVAVLYPGLMAELEEILGWDLGYKPTVLLIKDRATFQERAGSPFFTAFAVPRHGTVVIDYSRMAAHPSLLRETLKHELCHLLLHRHIEGANLPKWLDEGVAQWVSGGMAEIIMDRERFILTRAVLSGRYFRISDLVTQFPTDQRGLLTAYEQSKDLIEYIVKRFGVDQLLDILGHLKEGASPDRAIYRSLFISLNDLEREWIRDLRKRATWLTYLSVYLYEILFFLGALLTVLGFIRVMIRKRNYRDDDFPFDA